MAQKFFLLQQPDILPVHFNLVFDSTVYTVIQKRRMRRKTLGFATHPLIVLTVIGFPCTMSDHLAK